MVREEVIEKTLYVLMYHTEAKERMQWSLTL